MTEFIDKLICGDAVSVMEGMPDECIDLIVTSPPYNCRKDYGVCDEMSWNTYYEFLSKFLDEAYRVIVIGGTLALNIPLVIRWQRDHKYADSWTTFDPTYKTHRGSEKVSGQGRIEPVGIRCFNMMLERDIHVREPIVWVKGRSGVPIATTFRMGSDANPCLRSTHEHILLGSKGRWFHRGGTGRRGRTVFPNLDHTKDVWLIPAASSRKHPAVFPIEIPTRLIKLFTHAADAVVLDPFMGLGTTMEAAIRADRHYLGIDLSEKYCAIAGRRVVETMAEVDYEDRQGNIW